MKFRFKDFRVYEEARQYCSFANDIIKRYIDSKDKGLRDQLSRALISIVLNIAEGSADHSDKEFARFLSISTRSVYETVADFDLANLYGYINDDMNLEIEEKAHNLVKQLATFRNKLKGN